MRVSRSDKPLCSPKNTSLGRRMSVVMPTQPTPPPVSLLWKPEGAEGTRYLNFFSGLLYDPPALGEAMAVVCGGVSCCVSVLGRATKNRPKVMANEVSAVTEEGSAMCRLGREQA